MQGVATLRTRIGLGLATAALLLPGCGQEGGMSDGIRVNPQASNLRARPAESGESSDGTQIFYNTEGARIGLEGGFLRLVARGLERCDSASPVDVLRRWLLSEAWAHGGESEAPAGFVDVTEADGTVWELGALTPPPGRYCGLRLALEPDRDEPHEAGGTGSPAFLSGYAYARPVPMSGFEENGPHEEFEIALDESVGELTLPFPEPLILDRERRSAEPSIAIAYDTWFDGVDVEALDTPEARQQLATNIAASLTVDIR